MIVNGVTGRSRTRIPAHKLLDRWITSASATRRRPHLFSCFLLRPRIVPRLPRRLLLRRLRLRHARRLGWALAEAREILGFHLGGLAVLAADRVVHLFAVHADRLGGVD